MGSFVTQQKFDYLFANINPHKFKEQTRSFANKLITNVLEEFEQLKAPCLSD